MENCYLKQEGENFESLNARNKLTWWQNFIYFIGKKKIIIGLNILRYISFNYEMSYITEMGEV